MAIVGNPQDYIMIFGGSSSKNITDSTSGSIIIKETLDDLWVFNLRAKKWIEIFVNSLVAPPKSEYATMVTVKSDRLVLLYGG